MKKLLSVIITLSASCFMGICQNYIEIDLTGKHIHTRSLTDAPEASISNDILTVSFDGSGMYSLYIEDSFGVTVYSSALPANGMEYDYDPCPQTAWSTTTTSPASEKDSSASSSPDHPMTTKVISLSIKFNSKI